MSITTRARHLRRYGEIGRLLVKYGRSDLVKEMNLAGFDVPVDLRESEGSPPAPPEAEQLATDLESLGATFVKFGQLLSTRVDIIPPAYATALARLQDDVEPVPLDDVVDVFTDEIGTDPFTVFAEFDAVPLASASLGQVHRARLRSDGRDVVVKVQRPGIRPQIAEDLEAIGELATFLDAHTDAGRRFGFAELFDQFARTLRDELDYTREAANLARLREIVAPYPQLVVPAPIDDLTTARVLTMEHVQGRKVTSITPVGRTEIDAPPLADALFRAYLDQILVEGFFHADPHPGNVLLTDDGRIALIDLGMVARVPSHLQDDLVNLLVAVSDGRGEEASRMAIRMGRPLEGFDEERFVRGASDLVVRNVGLGVGSINAGALVAQLTQLAGESRLRLPPELAMLGKALLNLDQVSRTLDPDFDPAGAIQSHVNAILQARLRPSRERLFSAALEARQLVEELPGRINRLMDAAASGDLRLKVDAIDEQQWLAGMQKVANRITMGLVLAALIVGAAMMTRVETPHRLFGYPALATVCFVLASVGATALCLTIVASDHRRPRK